MRNTQSRLKARGEFDRWSNETQQEWVARMRAESAKVDANIQKFGVQKQRLRVLSNIPRGEESKAGTQSSQKSGQKPPSNLRRVSSFVEPSEVKPAREREGSQFFEKLATYMFS